MLKETLKKNNVIRRMYITMSKWKNVCLSIVAPKLQCKIMYKENNNEKLDLENPKFFGEKLMWLKLNDYNNNKLVSKCADKYTVREYIKDMECEEILNELYGVYEDARDINWDELPEKFVLKCTHGCGFNIVCTNKEQLNKEETIKKLNAWKKEKFGYESGELHYTHIKPKIICEKYLETDAGFLPNDYKILCFNGEPQATMLCTEREKKVKFTFLDMKWKVLNIVKDKYKTEKKHIKPENFDQMVDYARKLAKPFRFVRVDFYDYNGKVVFGELTFTPAGCVAPYLKKEGEKILGQILKL